NHSVKLVEIFSKRAPILSKLHTEISEREAPGPGAEECVNVKLGPRHAGDAGRQRNEGANHRQQAADEDGEFSPAEKKTVSPVEFTVPHQYPTTVPLDQRAASISANLVGHKRTQVASDRTRGCDQRQLESASENQISGEGHDQLRRQGNACGFD